MVYVETQNLCLRSPDAYLSLQKCICEVLFRTCFFQLSWDRQPKKKMHAFDWSTWLKHNRYCTENTFSSFCSWTLVLASCGTTFWKSWCTDVGYHFRQFSDQDGYPSWVSVGDSRKRDFPRLLGKLRSVDPSFRGFPGLSGTICVGHLWGRKEI